MVKRIKFLKNLTKGEIAIDEDLIKSDRKCIYRYINKKCDSENLIISRNYQYEAEFSKTRSEL